MSRARRVALPLGAAAALMAAAVAAPLAAQGPPPFPTQPPVLGPLRPLSVPPITVRTLPNGLTLWVAEQHELPLVDVSLIVRTGPEADPADRLGLATLTADLLDEGTTTRSALAIADQAQFLGAQLATFATWEQTTISLHVPTTRLDSALALFADVALRPAFGAEELERLRASRLTALLQARDQGPQIASRLFAHVVFGERHPYGRPVTGTEATTRAITRDDVARFHATWYRPNNAVLLVVGDITPDDAERRIATLFGGWPRAAVPPRAVPAPPATRPTTIVLVDKPGAPQASFRIGGPGIARRSPDAFAVLVMNTVLGGSFTSRLNDNLREKKGYTYGANSGFAQRRGAGPWTASAEVVSAKSDSALLEFLKELRAIRTPVPDAELQKTREYLQRQLAGDFESTRDILGQLVPLAVYGLPRDYWNRYTANVGAVRGTDVQRVARTYIDPERLTIVIVGDRASLEPALRATGVGPIEIRDLDGKIVR
ncbi:MAG: insulinase family protein [Gemmatimonadaceae bacterium]|nr:insulinase family protein [Gemmatimonadaceae bacterium]